MGAVETKSNLLQVVADTLGSLDHGRVGAALEAAIRFATSDCMDRPGDDRARKVTLELQLKPVAEIVGDTISCEGANGVAKVRVRVPDRESGKLDFGVRRNGVLVFNQHSPANHKQATIFDDEDEVDQVKVQNVD